MQTMEKRESITHIQNLFLENPIDVYIKRENNNYIIAYEPKKHREHHLLFKISKNLVNNVKFDTIQKINFDKNIDINVRMVIESNYKTIKSIETRIIPTKYGNLPQLYGMVYQFSWRKTGAGGSDKLEFTIPECPVIVNSNTISNVCYKLISKQISGSGTHQLHTYLIIAPLRGQYVVGNHIRISNINNNGHRNMHIYPVTIML
jgi:hypothetical protein